MDPKRQASSPPTSSDQPALLAGESGAWHTLDVDEVAAELRMDAGQGLTEAEAAGRLQQYGPNVLAESHGRSPLWIFVDQFRSLIVLLLVAATGVAFAMGETIEAIAILIVILLNAVIGFLTEWRAEQALTALQKQAVATAQVIRDGEGHEIPAADLVPGDVVIIAAGARVPADGRVVEAARLLVEEAALTGESVSVAKAIDPISDPVAPLGERTAMVFMGTTITDGRGRFIVTATGAQTEMGKIGTLIDETGSRESPLERKLAQLGQGLILVVLALCAVIVVVGLIQGHRLLLMLEIGISLAIAAVPEGLPAVATMTLAMGMQRMARMRALVRRLPAVETLGSTTVICTDKTGTLTRNEMTVRAYVLEGERIDVDGTGYAAEGEFLREGQSIDAKGDAPLILALRIGALCNDASIELQDGESVVLGDPTEGALIVAAAKAGLDRTDLDRDYPRVGEVPFDSDLKRMITVHRTPEGRTVGYLKGGVSAVLEICGTRIAGENTQPLNDEDRRRLVKLNEDLAANALRVLALACRELPDEHDDVDLARDFQFVGLVGMIDPLREEAKEAITTCRKAGIRVSMITGDQPATAAEIARQLGLDRDVDGKPLKTVHARELEGLDQEGWGRVAAESAVFARVSPEHKLRIVEALRKQGHVVAMTGDGVNDAPALKAADIGIAMGIKGTEVAKETADMILTDDHFATIVAAVEQGRIVYANILKFVHYLFSCNLAEIAVVFTAIMLGWPIPLGALQILWLNLITDVFPAMALALEPSAPNMMKRPPRDPSEQLVNPQFVGLIMWQGMLLATVSLVAFRVGLNWYGLEGAGLRRAETMAFMTLALAQVVHAFNARSQWGTAFTSRLFTNGWLWAAVLTCVLLQAAAVSVSLLQRVLRTVPLSPMDWAVIITSSLAPLVVVEIVKLVQNHLGRRDVGVRVTG